MHMMLTLSWSSREGHLVPECRSDSRDTHGVSPLEGLLIDDGGQGHSASIPWLEEGLRVLAAVKRGNVQHGDWSRDAWAADLSIDRVRVHSLYDETCAETLSLESFERALSTWHQFVRSQPDFAATVSVAL